jgi:hypothetical protein
MISHWLTHFRDKLFYFKSYLVKLIIKKQTLFSSPSLKIAFCNGNAFLYERNSKYDFYFRYFFFNVKMFHQRMRNRIRSCLKTKVCGERDRAHYKSTSMNTLRNEKIKLKRKKNFWKKILFWIFGYFQRSWKVCPVKVFVFIFHYICLCCSSCDVKSTVNKISVYFINMQMR